MTRKKRGIIIVVTLLTVVLVAVVLIMHGANKMNASNTDTETKKEIPVFSDAETEADALWNGLSIESLSSYAGYYVEDGSNEIVSGIAAATIKNEGNKNIQLVSFSLKDEKGTEYKFQVTTLLPGQRATVLELNRLPYEFGTTIASVTYNNCSFFSEEPSLHSDKIRLLSSGNMITVENISSATVPTGKLYFKNISGSLLIGGITYSVSFPELAPGEKITLSPSHYNDSSCRIMFVTYAEQ
ncbi:MAG: hypothetical protein MJ102_07515 [Clostridia bacterium]|nr:hypothetical protein [Clostridia bacterium]